MSSNRLVQVQALFACPRVPGNPQERSEFASGEALLDRTAIAIGAGADPEMAMTREILDPANSDFVVLGFLARLSQRLPAALDVFGRFR